MTNKELITAFDRTNRLVFAAGACSIRAWGQSSPIHCPLVAIARVKQPNGRESHVTTIQGAANVLGIKYKKAAHIASAYDRATGTSTSNGRLVSYATAREALVTALSS